MTSGSSPQSSPTPGEAAVARFEREHGLDPRRRAKLRANNEHWDYVPTFARRPDGFERDERIAFVWEDGHILERAVAQRVVGPSPAAPSVTLSRGGSSGSARPDTFGTGWTGSAGHSSYSVTIPPDPDRPDVYMKADGVTVGSAFRAHSEARGVPPRWLVDVDEQRYPDRRENHAIILVWEVVELPAASAGRGARKSEAAASSRVRTSGNRDDRFPLALAAVAAVVVLMLLVESLSSDEDAAPTSPAGGATPARGAVRSASLFNADDKATLYLNRHRVASVSYGDRRRVSFDRPLTESDRLTLRVYNRGSGYTWGLRLRRRDGHPVVDREGRAGIAGANSDDQSNEGRLVHLVTYNGLGKVCRVQTARPGGGPPRVKRERC